MAEYLKDLNATQAAIRAGYSAKTAESSGPRLLGNVGVSAAIQAKQSQQLEKAGVTAEMVKARLSALAFQDIRQLFDAQGNLVPIHQLSDAAAVMVAGLEVIKKNAAAGDGIIDTVHKRPLERV